ncbi:MAG: oligopeptide/dipeptide ABC transporter ATP-binding protein, partial [Pseudomonadota bacterium]
LEAGRTLALVGESGCGKSTLGRAILRLVEPTAGTVRLDGQNVTALPAGALRNLRRQMQIIFQDPFGSLNPRMTVREALTEPMTLHGVANGADAEEKLAELLSTCGLSSFHADRYPHEFSGGQRQRVGVARALATRPKLIVCDEPVSALDVSVQAQILNLLRDLQRTLGVAYIFISHDLAVVRQVADRVAVMYLGRIVEEAPAERLFAAPLHPYTRSLLAAAPRPDPSLARRAAPVLGDTPSALDPPSGCSFHPRCPMAEARCATERPLPRQVGDTHVACHFAEESPMDNAAPIHDGEGMLARRLKVLSSARAAREPGRESAA